MGVGPGYRSSNGQSQIADLSARLRRAEEDLADAREAGDTRNPDPTRWHIIRQETAHGLLLLDVLYPNCTNREGRKVMLFGKGVTLEQIVNQRTLDPHFGDAGGVAYPIARFTPDDFGWEWARRAAGSFEASRQDSGQGPPERPGHFHVPEVSARCGHAHKLACENDGCDGKAKA